MDDLGGTIIIFGNPHISEMNLYETHFEPGRQARLQPSLRVAVFFPLLRDVQSRYKLQDEMEWNFRNGQRL